MHNTLDGPVAQISGSFGPVLEYVHYTDWQNLQDLSEIDFSELMDDVTPSKPTPWATTMGWTGGTNNMGFDHQAIRVS